MNKKICVVVMVATATVVVTAGLIWTAAGAQDGPRSGPAASSSKGALASDPEVAAHRQTALQAWDAGPAAGVALEAKPVEPAVHAPWPAIVPPVDWSRYPGTLNSQIQQALLSADGVMAADLARKLRECDLAATMTRPDMIQKRSEIRADAALLTIMNEQLQVYQRVLATCQTVADWRRSQLELLDVAVAQKVIGAAVQSFHLGQRRSDVLQGVLRDAMAGDVSSLGPVTYHKPSTFGMSPDLQRELRYAFELAANDPEVGELVRRHLLIAESASVPIAGEAQARFKHEGLTDAQRAQAQATARQLVQRVKAPKDEVAKGR